MTVTSVILMVIGIGIPLLPAVPGLAQEDPPPPPALAELNEEIIKRSTVFVFQTYQTGGQTAISCVGSGMMVSTDGLILTNAHIALPSDTCQSDQIVIGVTVRLDEPPVPVYTAEVLDADRGLDLAVLRINGYLDGRPIERGALQLPFVELGDSATVELDDTIVIAGYPDFGDAPVEIERGTVSGFTAEARAGDRAWIRTSATIPGTMSGGGAFDRDGRLIGIPTIAPARVSGEAVDCRIIQDTNQDGLADSNDGCVPVGGFISALRPARLARGLVRAATLGIRQGEARTPSGSPDPEGAPTFSRLFFTTRINEAGVPTNVISRVPAGTTSLYLFFDYANMVDGMVYELRVTVDDIQDADYSLPPVTWSGGPRGTWFIGRSGTPWRNGFYVFRLFIEGREVASARIQIGGGPTSQSAFSDIIFGLLDSTGNLIGTNYVLPEGSVVQARFNYRNMQPGVEWTYIWYLESIEVFRDSATWDFETYGTQGTRTITGAGDFFPGQYRLELYIAGQLSATADFVIAGGAVGSRTEVFPAYPNATGDPGTIVQFATALDDGAPAGTIRAEFPAGIDQVFAFFNWRQIAPGTMWTRRWTVDNDLLFEITEPWQAPPEGENFYLSLDSLETIPDGAYGLEISIANVTLASAVARVGLGQLRADTFETPGIQMLGRITDAETGQGIPGALFIVLDPDLSVEDFLWQQNQVLGISVADQDGEFQIPDLLPRGSFDEPLLYSVLVRAEGYLPVSADGIAVNDRTASPVEINVELSRN